MKVAIEQFRKNIQRVKNLELSYAYLATNTELDMSDILRAEIILLVSALDTFIHDVVRLGMLEILKGERKQTSRYKRFSITMNIISFDEEYSWFERAIREEHGKLTFQRAEKIKEIIEYILEKRNIWELVADRIGKNKNDIIKQLNLIIKRRDQIAHESDIDPSYPDTMFPIEPDQTKEAILFIEEIVDAIYVILTT